MTRYIEPRKIAERSPSSRRRGEIVLFSPLGQMDLERDKNPPRKTPYFRIYSMTKPIASVALMMLARRGHSSSRIR